MGFEPTPYKWLVPKTSALDHSATLPSGSAVDQIYNLNSTQLGVYSPRQWIIWASLQQMKKNMRGKINKADLKLYVHASLPPYVTEHLLLVTWKNKM